MRRVFLSAAMVALFLALPAPSTAQGLTGTWALEVEGPRGDQTVTLDVVQEGEALTGTVRMRIGRRGGGPGGGGPGGGAPGGDMPELEIVEGSVTGDSFSFLVAMEFNGTSIEQLFEGTFDGNEMSGTLSGRRGERAFTGTRGD
ncbi:MAG: hypothetical protein AAF389_11530 [Gemmatimonadota bacterium]